MKSLPTLFYDFVDKSTAILSSLSSLYAPSSQTHDARHQSPPKHERGTKWLEHRGYRTSFADDDEVKPDPKEDALVIDEPVNLN